MKDKPLDLQRAARAPTQIFDPRKSLDVEVYDRRAEIAKITSETPPTQAEVESLLNLRSPFIPTTEEFRSDRASTRGGVGAGVFYKKGAFPFKTSSAIDWHAIAPRKLMDGPHSLIYLTATDQVPKGCEALVSYQDGFEGVFRVWDWATPKQPNGTHWVVGLPRAKWGNYLLSKNVAGSDLDALYIVNRSSLVAEGTWRNEVFLYDGKNDRFELVWSFDYPWVLTPEVKLFDWGPIIETFDPPFDHTNLLGCADATVLVDGTSHLLLPENSFIRNDGHGFTVQHLIPNHTLLAD
jgi:hypothetical protein